MAGSTNLQIKFILVDVVCGLVQLFEFDLEKEKKSQLMTTLVLYLKGEAAVRECERQ